MRQGVGVMALVITVFVFAPAMRQGVGVMALVIRGRYSRRVSYKPDAPRPGGDGALSALCGVGQGQTAGRLVHDLVP